MKTLSGKNILVVDDEHLLREILRDELEVLGANVIEAEGGHTAISLVEKQNFDIVITDVRMPNGDGIELLDRIRARDRHLPIVIFITGFSDLTEQKAFDKGASAIFSKPFNMDDILKAIDRLIQKPEERWLRKYERFDSGLEIITQLSTLNSAIENKLINIGQGGMFLHLTGDLPASNTSVDFKIEFKDPSIPTLVGQGIVRWRREASADNLLPGIGIEFSSLDPKMVDVVRQIINLSNPTAFIPRS